MDKRLEQRLEAARRFAFRGRSPLYRYLRTNFEQFTAAGFGTDEGPSWQVLTGVLMQVGQVNSRGQPLTRAAVIGVFRRVQRDVAEERRRQLTGVRSNRHQPSRAPATWQPPVAHSGSPGQAAAPTPARASLSPPASGAVPGEDSFDRAFRRLAERSGR